MKSNLKQLKINVYTRNSVEHGGKKFRVGGQDRLIRDARAALEAIVESGNDAHERELLRRSFCRVLTRVGYTPTGADTDWCKSIVGATADAYFKQRVHALAVYMAKQYWIGKLDHLIVTVDRDQVEKLADAGAAVDYVKYAGAAKNFIIGT